MHIFFNLLSYIDAPYVREANERTTSWINNKIKHKLYFIEKFNTLHNNRITLSVTSEDKHYQLRTSLKA